MAWVWLDDAMPEHPKVAALSAAAFRAFVSSLCYCSRARTDGFVPENIGRGLAPVASVRRELEATPIKGDPCWVPVAGGWRIPSYLEYQPSADELDAAALSNRDRQRRYRERRRAEAAAAAANAGSDGERNALRHGVGRTTVTPTPTYNRSDQVDHARAARGFSDICGKAVHGRLTRPRALAKGDAARRLILRIIGAELERDPSLGLGADMKEHVKALAAKVCEYDATVINECLDVVAARVARDRAAS